MSEKGGGGRAAAAVTRRGPGPDPGPGRNALLQDRLLLQGGALQGGALLLQGVAPLHALLRAAAWLHCILLQHGAPLQGRAQ